MRKLRSDWVLAENGLRQDAVLVLDESGTVTDLRPALPTDSDAEYLPGLICPAFVNAHCHLELSHLHGMIPRGTGMAGFIGKLMGIRSTPSAEEREASIQKAARAMWERGISAVGDICNGPSTLATKRSMPEIEWFNFVEVFGSDPGRADEIYENALDLAEKMGPKSAITLHAPYSVSIPLRDQVLEYAALRGWRQSIHLLESAEERQLFEELDGPLLAHLRRIGLKFQGHTYSSPIDYMLEKYPPEAPGLLVHNTEMSAEEIKRIATRFPDMYFVLCPLANDFIHGTVPPAGEFAAYPDRVCIGTDSLAGNDQLDIYAEIHFLQQKTGLPTELLLRWATVNGARALGVPEDRHTIRKGSNPILLNLNRFEPDNSSLPAATEIIRIQV